MKTKHTPGPWKAPNSGPCVTLCREPEANLVVAVTANHVSQVSFAAGVGSLEDAANSRLIAASPDLLELAKEFDSYLSLKLEGFRREYPEHHCIVQTAVRYQEQARAALRKALPVEGQEVAA